MRSILLVAAACLAVAACGPLPDERAQYQAACASQNGTYQDEGGPNYAVEDPECLVAQPDGRIIEIEYEEED